MRIDLELKDKILKFKNYNRSMRVPFIIHADFEAFTTPLDSCENDPSKSFTSQYQYHKPSSFCYYIKCFDDELYSKPPVTYTAKSDADDVAKVFIEMLEADVEEIYKKYYKYPKPMIFTEEDEKAFMCQNVCNICEKEFKLGELRARDHCHLTGKFRGAAHNDCNLNYQLPTHIPVVFHNLSGYDTHMFIKKLTGWVGCIPNNEENYISLFKKIPFENKDGKKDPFEIRFVDSFRSMASSLDSLLSNLTKDQCTILSSYYTSKQLDL